MSIIDRKDGRYTRIRVPRSEQKWVDMIMSCIGVRKIRESSRYVYFEAEGDWLNAGKDNSV